MTKKRTFVGSCTFKPLTFVVCNVSCTLIIFYAIFNSDQARQAMVNLPLDNAGKFTMESFIQDNGGDQYFTQCIEGAGAKWDTVNLMEKKGDIAQMYLTLFTSLKPDKSNARMYRNTIDNWAQFIPFIQPVLIDDGNHPNITTRAEHSGWRTITRHQLEISAKDGFREFNSVLIGFANGQVLFDLGLMSTLMKLVKFQDPLDEVFMTGRSSCLDVYGRDLYVADDVTRAITTHRDSSITAAGHYCFFNRGGSDRDNALQNIINGGKCMLGLDGIMLDASCTIGALYQYVKEEKIPPETREFARSLSSPPYRLITKRRHEIILQKQT